MRGMPQRILILCLIFFFLMICRGKGAEWLFSLQKGPHGSALNHPQCVDFYNSKFYVCDSGNARLISYNLKGEALIAFNPEKKLVYPVDMDFETKDKLWIVDKLKRGVYLVNFTEKQVKFYKIFYKNIQLYPVEIQIYKNKVFFLDKETGGIAEADLKNLKKKNNKIKIERIYLPEDSDFKGFCDFKVKQNGIWALSRLEKRVYYWEKGGNLKIYNLKKEIILPISIDIKGNDIFILDRYLKKVLIYNIKTGKKVGEIGRRGWNAGEFYKPVKIKILNYNYLGVVDEGNGKVEIFQF